MDFLSKRGIGLGRKKEMRTDGMYSKISGGTIRSTRGARRGRVFGGGSWGLKAPSESSRGVEQVGEEEDRPSGMDDGGC